MSDEPGLSAGAVLRATASARDAVGRARAALLAAGAVGWVSAAADAYQAVLDDALADAARVAGAVDAAEVVVLRHVRAAEVARAAAAAEEARRAATLAAWVDDALAIGTGRRRAGVPAGPPGAGG
ncbi:hypothetical protein [Actinotalea sp. JY-7876]|uniref:hypothetical protein n=1 Tax=Actinotalea sp. JY-7876 TaxID=2758442 RepID=UPI0015F6A107|nr:hypothetical protein [Actinotalea sp. JY-7876]